MDECQTESISCHLNAQCVNTIGSYDCRCCKLSLKLQYGDSCKSLSTENLFKPSNKKAIEGEVLSQVLEQAGIEVICLTDFANLVQQSSEGHVKE